MKAFWNRLAHSAAALALCATMSSPVFAQSYPTRPITLVYPYPAGSTTDSAWRVIAQETSKQLGQPIVFENRAGASGKIGLAAVTASAARDGYLLGIINNTLSVLLPLMDPGFRAEAGKDFTPISLAIETYAALVANPGVPFRDIEGLVKYAKANPGKLNFGSAGSGTPSHLNVELLKRGAGIDVVHVPYKGEAPALNDLLGGQVQAYFGVGILKPHVEARKLIGLATTGPERWALFPNLPTFREAGYPGVLAASWLGLIGPSGLPRDVVARANRALSSALQEPEVRRKLAEQGWVTRPSTPEEFEARIKSDVERWTPIIRSANIKLN